MLTAKGWLPQAPNDGWIYRDRIDAGAAGLTAVAYYISRYGHSTGETWLRRLEAGEITHNGKRLQADGPLGAGDRLAWHRPPWEEASVPGSWRLLFDDGDLYVIDKPSGLPVLPAGGFLEHTLLRLLEKRFASDPGGTGRAPRPVHRLGRFTSGVLVCARRPQTRRWLSAQLRQSSRGGGRCGSLCRKVYRALVSPGRLPLAVGEQIRITVPIGRQPHPLLGEIWCAAAAGDPGALKARSAITLLERHPDADLVAVAIATGRPHQIRIHCAAAAAPLLGDPLYLPGGAARPTALPGEGGYRLHAHRLRLTRPEGGWLELEAPVPEELQSGADPAGSVDGP